MTTSQSQARLAGILYFVTHATSVAAVVLYGSGTNLLGLRLGAFLEFWLALACVGTGILLLPLLRPFGEVRAVSFALLRTLEAAVILAGTLPMVAMARSGSVSETLIGLHSASFLVGQGLVIGVNTLMLASLLLTSGLVPRALALLGLVGGALVLASDVGQLFEVIPFNGPVAGVCALPIFTFEVWFAITLVIGRRFGTAHYRLKRLPDQPTLTA